MYHPLTLQESSVSTITLVFGSSRLSDPCDFDFVLDSDILLKIDSTELELKELNLLCDEPLIIDTKD